MKPPVRALRQRVGARYPRAVRAVVARPLQALQVEVQVAHRQLSANAPVNGNVRERKAVRMAAVSPRSADLEAPGERPGNVLPWTKRYSARPRTGSTAARLSIR